MGITLFVPAAIYSLHTTELILTVFAALLTGFLLKLLVDQWRKAEQQNESQELQAELEALQHRLSTEMIRKEEVERGLEGEIEAAEMRNVELQLQYAKALHFVEQLRAGNAKDGDAPETSDGQQILYNLQDKITRQERHLLELEQQLEQLTQSRDRISADYQELLKDETDYSRQLTKIETEKNELALQLQELLQEKADLNEQQCLNVQQLKNELQERQDQLVLLERKLDLLVNSETTLKELVHEMQTKQQVNSAEEFNFKKEGIATIQSAAKDVASRIEQFRDQLTNILRDTYSYEQLLLSHEGLQHSIEVLRQDLHTNEEQLTQLQTEKSELEQQFNQKSGEWRSREDSRLNQTMLLESNLLQLREDLVTREKQLEDLQVDKNNMESTLVELQQKYHEKEQMAREMMTVVRDMESRFARFYKTSNGETFHQEREEIQLR